MIVHAVLWHGALIGLYTQGTHWVLRDIVDPVSGANCTTELKAKNHPPAVSMATSAPRGPNLQVAPFGLVGIGYKLPSWTVMWRYPQLRDLMDTTQIVRR